MMVDMMTTLLKAKFKLTNIITDELPSPIQEKINKHKKNFLHSVIELLKDEITENSTTPENTGNSQIHSISIE